MLPRCERRAKFQRPPSVSRESLHRLVELWGVKRTVKDLLAVCLRFEELEAHCCGSTPSGDEKEVWTKLVERLMDFVEGQEVWPKEPKEWKTSKPAGKEARLG